MDYFSDISRRNLSPELMNDGRVFLANVASALRVLPELLAKYRGNR